MDADSQNFSETPLIDEEQFSLLVETGEDAAAEMLQELIDMFMEESAPRVHDLRDAVTGRDYSGIVKHAHAIAGSSGNLGGLRLSQACRALENEAPNQNDARIEFLMGQVDNCFQLTIDTYNQRIQELG